VTSIRNLRSGTELEKEYIDAGRLLYSRILFDDREIMTTYDYEESPTCQVLGQENSAYNRFLPKTITNPEGNSTALCYDDKGNLTSVTDALNNTTSIDRNTDDGTIRRIKRPRGETSFD